MNFFKHQQEAKKQSQKLVLFFIVTVILLIFTTNFVVLNIFGFLGVCGEVDFFSCGDLTWPIVKVVSLCTLLLIVGGSLIKYLELRSDPMAIAKILGGSLVEPGSSDPLKRRLHNVVEEMAIASGVPVPKVYILTGEKSLNALAAGYDLNNSLVAVTEGLLLALNREELQAVIAHEFSHIVHGDMVLNRKLLATVNGVAMISAAGAAIVRSTSRRRYTSHRNGKDSAFQLVCIGFAIFVIGYLGLLMSRILKASISRQREYLADASAVKYTRNPAGLSSCFKKIMAIGDRQFMEDKSKEAFSHMFFANSFFKGFGTLFSTHPAMEDRIKRLEPRFDYQRFLREEMNGLEHLIEQKSVTGGFIGSEEVTALMGSGAVSTSSLTSKQIVSSLGEINDESILHAQNLRQSISRSIQIMINDPIDAQCLVYALFMSIDDEIRFGQMVHIADKDMFWRKRLRLAYERLAPVSEELKFVIFELCLATLKTYLSDTDTFLRKLRDVISAKGESLLEDFLAYEFLRHSLQKEAHLNKSIKLKQMALEVELFFVMIAKSCASDEKDWKQLYQQAVNALGLPPNSEIAKLNIKGSDLRRALEHFSHLGSLEEKELLVSTALELIHSDGRVLPVELKLMRLLCLSLGVPMPLLVATKNLSS